MFKKEKKKERNKITWDTSANWLKPITSNRKPYGCPTEQSNLSLWMPKNYVDKSSSTARNRKLLTRNSWSCLAPED